MTALNATVQEMMQQSGVAFGTSGARGLVSAMTDRICHGYTTGFLQYLLETGAISRGGRVALAGDLRPSTPRIMAACAQAIRDLGGEPVNCGFVPTPALALWAFAENIPSIMVTGSHIPDDRNGIKFYRPDGEILKDDEAGITRQIVTVNPDDWSEDGALLTPAALPPVQDVETSYVARYVNFFGTDALTGLRLGVYQHSAVGRDVLVTIFEALGAEVLPLGRSAKFIPVDTEAVREEDITLARQWAAQLTLDGIASTDGDSDRPLLADHKGEWLRGDVLSVLCARALNAATVVTPVSSNTLVEKSEAFTQVMRTRIGSPYVIAAMNSALAEQGGMVCGYEANGGFLLATDAQRADRTLTALPTRDAVLPILAVLIAARPGRTSDLLAQLPQRVTFSDRLQDFHPEQRDTLMEWLLPAGDDARLAHLDAQFGGIAGGSLTGIDLLDGVRMTFSNARVIHLRGSGNAPELRCYTEAEDEAVAKAINGATLNLIKNRFPKM